MVNKLGTSARNKISLSLSVRLLRAKVKMFCQDVALKKSMQKSHCIFCVYFFGSLDRLFLRAKFALQMSERILAHVGPKNQGLRSCPIRAQMRARACALSRTCVPVDVREPQHKTLKAFFFGYLAVVLSSGEKCSNFRALEQHS